MAPLHVFCDIPQCLLSETDGKRKTLYSVVIRVFSVKAIMKGRAQKMKKILSILLILAMVLSLGVTAFAEDRRDITSAEFPFYLMDDDSGEKVTLYFLDGVTDLP